MRSFLFITCCLVVFTFFNGIADNSIISSTSELLQPESQPQQSGSSIVGGLLILVSIIIGYGTRKVYEIRSRSQEEIK